MCKDSAGLSQNDVDQNNQPTIDSFCQKYGLSPREKDVLIESMWGYSMIAIGNNLFISRETVKTHLRHIYQKTDCHSKSEVAELVRKYLSNRQ